MKICNKSAKEGLLKSYRNTSLNRVFEEILRKASEKNPYLDLIGPKLTPQQEAEAKKRGEQLAKKTLAYQKKKSEWVSKLADEWHPGKPKFKGIYMVFTPEGVIREANFDGSKFYCRSEFEDEPDEIIKQTHFRVLKGPNK